LISTADEFVGQERSRALLGRYIARGRLSGTFLLLGQRGLGKSTLATIVARSLCCTGEKPAERLGFCGSCYACRTIESGQQPEYVCVRPLGQDITVKHLDENHDGLRTALYHPNLLSHRVFVIEEAHHLNDESGNRLLKLFEEAPQQTVFLLTTDRPEMLLPTIHSRGQKIPLVPLPERELREALQARGVAAADATEAARLSGGRYVDALGLSGSSAWRQSVLGLARAIEQRSSVPEAAADAAGYEHAALWHKEQADHGMQEAELEKVLPKARQNELVRQGLISAYDRASWWMLHGSSGGASAAGQHGNQGSGNRDQGSGTRDQGSESSRTSRVGRAAGDARAGMSDRPAAESARSSHPGMINMDHYEGAESREQRADARRESGNQGSGTGDRGPEARIHSGNIGSISGGPTAAGQNQGSGTGNQGSDGSRTSRVGRAAGDARAGMSHRPAAGTGPLHDPDYMAKLSTLRKRISGNVDRELAQLAFEASL
jgi:hypothetical protein